MAHELNALLGKMQTLEPAALEHEIPVVVLRQDFGLIPLTVQIIQALAARKLTEVATNRVDQRQLDEVFKDWSARGPVIHATNEVYGGVGEQTARMWQNGALVFAQVGSPYSGPISMALQRLGATGGRLGWDEFDVLGLGRHRATKGWLATGSADV